MEKKIISLPTNDDKFYRQILEVMNFLLRITPQERDVLAELIRLDHEYEALPQDKRSKFILSTEIRKEICLKINLKDKQFNVILYKLKQKFLLGNPLIGEDHSINPDLKIKPDSDGFRFEINFIQTKFIPKVIVKQDLNEEEIVHSNDEDDTKDEEEFTIGEARI